jgi:hypothetical protein
MKALIAVFFMLFISSAAFAQTISIKDQNDLYEGCVPSCKNGGAGLDKDRPFITTAYCSCYCSKLATTITQKQFVAVNKNGANEPSVKGLINSVAKSCSDAVK